MAYQEVKDNANFHDSVVFTEAGESVSATSGTFGDPESASIMTVVKASDDTLYIKIEHDGEHTSGSFHADYPAFGPVPGIKIKGRNNEGWIVGWSNTTILNLRRYSSNGIETDGGHLETNISTFAGSHHADFDTDDTGRVIAAGIQSIIGVPQNAIYFEMYPDSPFYEPAVFNQTVVPHIVSDYNDIGSISIVCHKRSGKFTIVFIDRQGPSKTIYAYRFASDGTSLGPPIIVHSSSPFSVPDYTNRLEVHSPYGSDGFIVVWETTVGSGHDDLQFMSFDENGVPLYSFPTHVSTNGGPATGRWRSCLATDPSSIQTEFKIIVRAQDAIPFFGSQLEKIHIFNGVTGIVEQSIEVPLSADLYVSAVAALNEHEIRAIYNPSTGDGSIGQKIFVTQSIQMGLWLKDRDVYIYSDQSGLDNAAEFYADVLYGSPYSNTEDDSRESFESNQENSDITSMTFSGPGGFLGQPDDPTDTIFIGGPLTSEVVSLSLNVLSNHIQTVLWPQFPVFSLKFLTEGRDNGLDLDENAPAIEVINSLGTYTLERHEAESPSFPGSTIIDYAMIIRVPLASNSTEEDPAVIWAGGINEMGTRAAAWCLYNYPRFRLGVSQAVIVKLEYGLGIDPNDYDPELANPPPGDPVDPTGGLITVVDAALINANNWES